MGSGWSSKAVEAIEAKRGGTAAPRPPNTSPAPNEGGSGAKNTEARNPDSDLPPPHFGTPGGPCSWLLPGGQAVALAGDHYGGRFRLVLTGARDADFSTLLAHVLAYQPPKP